MKPAKPYDNPRIFWDVDHTKMNVDEKYQFVIERVFDRGDVQDIRNCRAYFGDEVVTKVLQNAKFLIESRMFLASGMFNIPLEKMRCYTLRQSNPTLFPY